VIRAKSVQLLGDLARRRPLHLIHRLDVDELGIHIRMTHDLGNGLCSRAVVVGQRRKRRRKVSQEVRGIFNESHAG